MRNVVLKNITDKGDELKLVRSTPLPLHKKTLDTF